MGSLSIWHWVVVLAVLATPLPIARILKRDGLSPFWALLYFIPLVNVIALWVWGYSRPSNG